MKGFEDLGLLNSGKMRKQALRRHGAFYYRKVMIRCFFESEERRNMKHNIAYDDEKLKKAITKIDAINKELKQIAYELDTIISLEPPKESISGVQVYAQER